MMRLRIYNFLFFILYVAVSSVCAQSDTGIDFSTETRNYTTSKVYDINGKVISQNQTYFDEFGKSTQSQSWDAKTRKVWTVQTIHDQQGRPALTTSSAPIGASFGYKNGFIVDAGGAIFDISDLGTISTDPSTVRNTTNTVGAYYSDSGAEPFQDVTDRPYIRTFYDELNPGNTLKVVGGNKIDTNGDGTPDAYPQGFSYTLPAAQELFYAFGKDEFFEIINSKNIYNHTLEKTVTIDAHGVENVSFTTKEGALLATARSGEGPQKVVSSFIGDQKFVDIHLPKGCEGSVYYLGGSENYKVFDLKTGLEVTNRDALPAGVFRIVSLNDEYSYSASYIYDNGVLGGFGTPQGVNYAINYYDYTLNYYDHSGNITSSLPPIGFDNQAYASYNLSGTVTHLDASQKTYYEYDSTGQLLHVQDPDEGETWFKYRKDGQIRFSQNSKQASNDEFSYANYDDRGRLIESGTYSETSTYSFSTTATNALDNIIESTSSYDQYVSDTDFLKNSSCTEQHFTQYDVADATGLQTAFGSDSRAGTYSTQKYVDGNISKTYTQNPSTTTTWYSYDIYGRVSWLAQQIEGISGVKTIDYIYDDITGNVAKVYYQKGVLREAFIHRYTYDRDDNRLIRVETATNDSGPYLVHADYQYYETGDLKRVELAEGLQGIDYVYNLNGSLKAINHPSLDSGKDPGGDANDIFGMMIDYYNGDYKRSGTSMNTSTAGNNQYNGNIKAIRWNNKAIDPETGTEKTYAYQYNRNNWLTDATFGQNNGGVVQGTVIVKRNEEVTEDVIASEEVTLEEGVDIESTSTEILVNIGGFFTDATRDYEVSGITYDANGNIQTLRRNKDMEAGSNQMDHLSYRYIEGHPNQLLRVEDAVTTATNADDIKTQGGENYAYNNIGQLVDSKSEDIIYAYNTSGLVAEVRKNDQPLVRFSYNDRGQRVKKESYNPDTGNLIYAEVYVRDASGTPMAIYRDDQLVEHTIYGASRLGVYKRATDQTIYELTDHVGNVRALVARETAATPIGGTDYYPFGMAMPNRSIQGDYRYAYQGQEKDTETGKEAFELRLWDSRIGRWLTTDPAGQYASPYLGMGNNPISRIDPDGGMDEDAGLEEVVVTGDWYTPIKRGVDWLNWNVMVPFNDNLNPLAWLANGTWGIATGYDTAGRQMSQGDNIEEFLKLGTLGVGNKLVAMYHAGKIVYVSSAAVPTTLGRNIYTQNGFQTIDDINTVRNVPGLYIFDDATRGMLPYVGMSTWSVGNRLVTHNAGGRIGGQIYFKPMTGSRLTLEVQETIIINTLGGKAATANKVLPVSKARNKELKLGITNY